MHCLHLEYFPNNYVDYNGEQGGRFHQDIAIMEEEYHRRWDTDMFSDY